MAREPRARARIGALAAAAILPSLLSGVGPAAAGAWTLERGRSLLIIGGLASRASHGFAADRRRGAIPRFRKAEIGGLAEYGVSDRFTLRGRTEFRDLRQEDGEPERRTGLGFSEIGARVRFFERGGFVASGEGNLRIAKAEDVVDPAADGLLEAEYEARLLAGYGFAVAGRAGFANLETAYRLRDGPRPDEIRVDATLGLRPTPRLLGLAQIFSAISTGGGSGFEPYDYHKLQLSGVYDLTPRVSLQLGGFTTLAGRNALAEDGVVTALWLRF